ncbi:MAG: DUF4143 domain-containing protein, partial [Planctomycetota bacterium]
EYSTEFNEILNTMLMQFLQHGGYLPAICSYYQNQEISKAIYNTYSHWIVGDMLKHNKQEHYLREILKAIYDIGYTQVTWNSLSRYLSIEHHQTVSDYCNILEEIHVVNIQQAFQEHKLSGAPKKSRKIYFADPFIAQSAAMLLGYDSVLNDKMQSESVLIENVCIGHAKRSFPTYYIKGNKGEVDIVIVRQNGFLPMEIKWTNQLKANGLKQINLYQQGLVLTKNIIQGPENLTCLPVSKFLLHMSFTPDIFFKTDL